MGSSIYNQNTNTYYFSDWRDLNFTVTTKLYLYGQFQALFGPRALNSAPTIQIDMSSYMNDGPGMHASIANIPFVNAFMQNPSQFGLPPG